MLTMCRLPMGVQAERDLIVLGRDMQGDYEHFGEMDASTLDMLVAKGYADPDMTQNDSPTIAEFLAFMRAHPWALAHGYLIGRPRSDCRVSVEGLEGTPPTAAEAAAFHLLCARADEYTGVKPGQPCRAWWD